MTTIGIFAGLSTIDIIHNLTDFPSKNRKIAAQSQAIIVGGPATNASITFAFLGGSASLITPVGRHAIASLVREECRRFGVELIDLSPASEELPPISSVWVNQLGERNVVSVNTTRITIPSVEINPELLNKARILMVDGHAMKAGQAWARAAHEAGIAVVFDGGSWKPGTEDLIQNVDTAICSADFFPPGCSIENDAIDYLRLRGVRNIAITHGSDDVTFVSPTARGVIPVPRVEPVDTMGAGDILHGAFCFYAAQGLPFEDALKESAAIASNSCRYPGTREWMKAARRSASPASSIPRAQTTP